MFFNLSNLQTYFTSPVRASGLITLFGLLGLISSTTLHAEPETAEAEIVAPKTVEQIRYVSDRLALQLRSGPSANNRIIKTLRSGNKLTVTQVDEETGYSFVQLSSGTEGWVLSRFLIEKPTAGLRLAGVKQRLDNVQAELKQTQQRLTKANNELRQIRKDRSELERNSSKLSKELSYVKTISSNALALDEKTKKLTMRNQELEIQVEALTAQNDELKSDIQTSYILYGGGLVFAGILAGLLLPSLRGRRGNSGWA